MRPPKSSPQLGLSPNKVRRCKMSAVDNDGLIFYDCRSDFYGDEVIKTPPKTSAKVQVESDADKAILSKVKYDLPVDPGLRNKWLRGLKKLAAVRGNGEKTDPFQFFEVEHEPCNMLQVKVIRGRDITKGRLGDLVDVPDPYVVVYIPEAPDAKKCTRHIDNEPNPVWDEVLTFFLKPFSGENRKIVAEITLMDANYSVDEKIGSVEFDLEKVPVDGTITKTFSFFETSEVDIEFTMQPVYHPDLRYSLALCDEEKGYRSLRKKVVQGAMKKLMGFAGPRSLRETPTIAILGSGGGFRAMTAYSGAVKALWDSGIMDCATYIGGLSGSSWYVSTLYSHKNFPQEGPSEANKDIRSNIASSPFWLLRPECLMRYSHRLRAKRNNGQPVTFTDFFGMLIGQTLLGKEHMESQKLSNLKAKIKDASVPMPLFTCLHVRSNMSAMTFHDWVEFTPFEIGIAKYGTFLKTEYFGSKFFMGVLVRKFDESPMHFLQGVWGSAFSILFNRLLEKNSKSSGHDSSKGEDEREALNNELNAINKNGSENDDSDEENEEEDDEFYDADDDLERIQAAKETGRRHTWFTGAQVPSMGKRQKEKRGSIFSQIFSWPGKSNSSDKLGTSPSKASTMPRNGGSPPPRKNFLNSFVSNMFNSYAIMQTREFRAGKILNYMRGLSLNKTYPLSPFSAGNTIAEVDEFKHIDEPMECFRKKVHLVDAGLTFNTPYPPVLRPQRAVDLIISFDFSARAKDISQPFKEILLAEKWARMHHLPFPKIDPTVFDRDGMKECYVFKDESNERAPIIIHFVLCNVNFKKYEKPGKPRASGDKRGDFSIFDNPKTPYSTFNFQYANKAFDDLHNLMEFNTLLHVETIKEEIKHCIQLRRHSKTRCSITLNDITNSRHLSQKGKSLLVNALGEADAVSLD